MEHETKGENIGLLDIVDLKFLQDFQDAFSKSANVASIMVDNVGPITKPSNFTDFCIKYTRGSQLGYKRCNECDIKWGKLAAEKGEPIIYNCHSGLTDFVVPIMIDGKHIGSILGGQVFTSEPDEEYFKSMAKEFGIDENEYIDALRKIKIIPFEQVKAAAELMFVVANSISEVANKNYELLKKQQKDNLLNKTIEIIRESADIEEIKNYFVNLVSEYFEPDRTLFVDYNPATQKFMHFGIEKLKSPDIKSLLGISVEDNFPEFAEKLKTKKRNIIIKDLEKTLSRKKLLNYKAVESLSNSDAKSDYGLIVLYKTQIVGILIMHFTKKKRVLTSDELNFLKTIRNQVGIALYQAKLLQEKQQIADKLKKQVKQEALLRNISERIRSSLDINEIFEIIINELLNMFDADRISIVEYPNKDNYEEYVIRKEYKKREDIISPHNLDTAGQITKYAAENFFINEMLLVFNNILESDYPEFFKEFYKTLGTSSLLWVPIISESKLWGSIAIAKNDGNSYWSDEDAKFMVDIANQTSIAINQAELYETAQKNAENESILRRVMLSSSSTFNFEQIINSIVSEAGKLFDADRCFFIETDLTTNKNLPIKDYAEYLSSSKIRSHTQVIPEKTETGVFIDLGKIQKIICVENIDNLDLPEATRQMLVDKLSVKSYMIVSVKYDETIYGALVLHYVNKYKKFSSNDISMAEAIANQSANIINQVKTYDKMQKTFEREKILRKIIEITRSSLDSNEVKKQVVNELGKAFKADRCYFRAYDRIQDKFFPPDVEYLSSSDIKSLLNVEPNQEGLKYFSNELKKRSSGFYPVVANEDIAKGTPLETYMKSADMKADYAMPIIDSDEGFTWLVLHYSYEDPNFDDDYKKLLETIAFQVDTALKQIRLYNKTIQQREREKAILSNLPFMVWLKDRENRLLAANEPFAKMCGTTADKLVGKTDYELWPKELAQEYVNDDIAVMKTGKTKSVEELIQGPTGSRWHETYKTPLFDEKGEIVGTTGFARDITERKEIDRMKSEFVSTVSHELRTPLTSLSGALELVLSGKMGDFSEKIKSLLDMAYSNCNRLINLINDILDIEKIEAGKMDFEIKTLELMPLISQAIQLNLQYAQKFNVEIKLLENLPTVFVQVDANRLIQVITNLLSNAIKFSEANAPVEVSVIKINGEIRVSVTNYGAEIPEEFKGKIFQKFAQADSSDSRQKGGTGLGLSISKLIIEKMNGHINFISENNKTTFYFDLPEFINKQSEDLNEKTCFNM